MIINYTPLLKDILPAFKQNIQKFMTNYNDKPYIYLYPQNKPYPREIQIGSKRLLNKNINVYFMLYDNYEKAKYPVFRVLIYKIEDNLDTYKKIKKLLEQQGLSINYTKISGFHKSKWTNMIGNSDIPEYTFDESHSYSNNFVNSVCDVFEECYSKVAIPLFNDI